MKKYFDDRIIKLKGELKNKNLSNLIILKDENIYYLTGFYGKDSGSILLFMGEDIYLIVHFIYFEHARKTTIPANIKIIEFSSEKYKKLSEIITGYDIVKNIVNIEGQNISYSSFKKLQDLLSHKSKIKLKAVSNIVENLRIVKDEMELSCIEKACKIIENSYERVTKFSKSRLLSFSEITLAYEIEIRAVKRGSEGKSFNYVIASGSPSSIPHYETSAKTIAEGILLMDIGCKFNYYCSDLTRTVFLGNKKIDNQLIKIYDIVLQAQIRALQACKEGISCRELDRIPRTFITNKGYGKEFGHGLGHGLGLELHESPKVSYTDDTVLKENMVITIEPGIYIENYGGIRIEDVVIVKKNGIKNLYNSTKVLTKIG